MMDDAELRQRLDEIQKRADQAFASAEKTRKYFLAVIVVSVVAFVIPLVGLAFAIPQFISTYSSLGSFQ